MLSIGKLAVGQAGYYLDQAQTVVWRARAVSSGVEDYYLGGPEAPGSGPDGAPRWDSAGRSTRRGSIVCWRASIRGAASRSGRVLRERVPGFDLTFSAPKSVSVLFGIGDGELRGDRGRARGPLPLPRPAGIAVRVEREVLDCLVSMNVRTQAPAAAAASARRVRASRPRPGWCARSASASTAPRIAPHAIVPVIPAGPTSANGSHPPTGRRSHTPPTGRRSRAARRQRISRSSCARSSSICSTNCGSWAGRSSSRNTSQPRGRARPDKAASSAVRSDCKGADTSCAGAGAFPRRRGAFILTRRTLARTKDIVGELHGFGTVPDRETLGCSCSMRRAPADPPSLAADRPCASSR